MAESGRVLVTGGAGFIGSHVCEGYLERGWEVTALDDLSTGRADNLPREVRLVEADVRSGEVPKLFEERGFDLVNHHAAQIDVRASVADPAEDASVNVLGTLNLLESSVRHGVERFILVSSGGVVYGEPEELPISEVAPKRPLSPYGVGKLAGERYLFYYRKVHGLEGVTLRYSNVYGPRQDPHGEAGVVAIFSGLLAEGRPLTIFGDGQQTRDYVFVKDVVAANLLASRLQLPDPSTIDDVAFNVGTGRQTSVLELADHLMEVSDREVEVRHAEERAGELRHNALSIARLRDEGWEPGWSLREGLAETYRCLAAPGAS